MNMKFGKHIDKEIRKLQTHDMTRRNVKDDSNGDKLYDYMKIKEFRDEKKAQKKQAQQEAMLKEAQPVNQPSPKKEQAKSPQKNEVEEDETYLDKYNMFIQSDKKSESMQASPAKN